MKSFSKSLCESSSLTAQKPDPVGNAAQNRLRASMICAVASAASFIMVWADANAAVRLAPTTPPMVGRWESRTVATLLTPGRWAVEDGDAGGVDADAHNAAA